jgi:centromere protein C
LQQSPDRPQHNQQDDDDLDNSVQQVQDAVNDLFHDDVPADNVLSSARSTRSQKRKLSNPSSPVAIQSQSVPKYNKRQRPSLDHQEDQTIVDQTIADQTVVDHTLADQTAVDYTTVDQTVMDQTEMPDHTDAEYTYITVDQTEMPDRTEMPDQTELPEQTELPDQTELVNQTEVMDQTEAPEETGVEYTWVDQTVLDHTTYDQTVADETDVEQTVADETVMDKTEATHFYDHTMADIAEEDIAETTELPDEPIVETSAPLSTKKKRPFEVRKDAQPHEDDANDHDQEADVSSPSHDAQDFIPPPEDNVQDESEHEPEPEPTKKRGRAKGAAKTKGKKKQPSASVELRRRTSRDSESVGPDGLKKPGPKSIVNLRAGTPAEDEGAKTTRSGRTSIKPLKYWCNETYIWNQGEVEGIVRAEPVEQPKPKRAAPSRKKGTRLGPIKEDEEEDEDLLPEAWEQELGVINSTVRAWDPRTGTGSTDVEGVNEGMINSHSFSDTH